MSGVPALSVVVSTRDRPSALARCLDALAAQTRASALDVVVVDDGSKQASAVEEVVANCPQARLLRTGHRGVAGARNAGARAARASLIAFTDDDCIPARDWAAQLLRAFEAGPAAVAGRTENGNGNRFDAATQAVTEEFTTSALGTPPLTAFGAGSNLSCRQEVFDAVPFDAERYFRRAGEDRDWCGRLLAAGFRLVSEPAAVVYHHQGLDLRRFLAKHRRYGRGAYLVRSGSPRPAPLPPSFYLGLLRRGFALGPLTGLLVVVSQLATLVGFAQEALAAGRKRSRVKPAK
jgi:GT2 family glycosyltransferase